MDYLPQGIFIFMPKNVEGRRRLGKGRYLK